MAKGFEPTQRLKLLRQNLFASVGYGAHVPLEVAPSDGCTRISMPDGVVSTTSPLRWKLYKNGWRYRLQRLAREYGLGREYDLAPGDVVIDVGANIGEFTILAAAFGARVYAFEPDPTAAACFEANTRALDGVHLYRDVLWREETEIDFHLAPERADSSAFTPQSAHSTTRRIAQPLDSIAELRRIDRVKLIKCDAEGAEPEVLMGATRVLGITDVVVIDTGAERLGRRTNVECEALLASAGFDVQELSRASRSVTLGMKPIGHA